MGEEAGIRWSVDPTSSVVEFHARHLWGLVPVRGCFHRFVGSYQVGLAPEGIDFTLDAASVDTRNRIRDTTLCGPRFFDAQRYPQIRFRGTAVRTGGSLQVSGDLEAAGRRLPLRFAATIVELGEGIVIEASANADHRLLGMTFNPLGMLRAPVVLHVRVSFCRY